MKRVKEAWPLFLVLAVYFCIIIGSLMAMVFGGDGA